MYLATKRSRILDEAAEKIRTFIEEQGIQPGSRLPSERDLVKKLGVGRTSVREGLRSLELVGLVEVVPGKGMYLKEKIDAPLQRLIESWLPDHRGMVKELVELREAIETQSAYLAAGRAKESDILDMERAVAIMRAAVPENDVERFVEADTDFHDTIAKASGNGLLRQVLGSIAKEIFTFRMAAAYLGETMLQRSLSDHEAVLKAITEKNPAGALHAMREHIVRTPMDFHLIGEAKPDL
jgi:GntR family transcriptional repressor for pyruvate dehydrogenase complex